MERNIMWVPWSEPGFEHLRLIENNDGISVDGLIIGLAQNLPFRARYQIHCDATWNVREITLALINSAGHDVTLRADGKGHWVDESGNSVPSLDGCVDVDISATPFTNTLPIRRLGLSVGQSSELTVAYVAIPKMKWKPVRQRYTCLKTNPQGGLYKYEGLFRGFTAELRVDSDGLVVDYPETFRRIWPRSLE